MSAQKPTTTNHGQFPSPDCPSDATLSAFIEGRLTGEARLRVLEHMDTCGLCFEVVTEAMALNDGVDQKMPEVIEWPRRRMSGMLAAAGLAAAALLLFVFSPSFFKNQNDLFFDAEKATQHALVSLAKQGAIIERFQLPLPIEQEEVQAAIPTTRNASQTVFLNQEMSDAIQAWQIVLKDQPNQVNALKSLLSLGLLSGDFLLAFQTGEQLLKLDSSPEVKGYAILAKFLFENRMDGDALILMDDLYQKYPDNQVIVYNFARMLMLSDAAREKIVAVWNKYLELDDDSPYAAEARRYI